MTTYCQLTGNVAPKHRHLFPRNLRPASVIPNQRNHRSLSTTKSIHCKPGQSPESVNNKINTLQTSAITGVCQQQNQYTANQRNHRSLSTTKSIHCKPAQSQESVNNKINTLQTSAITGVCPQKKSIHRSSVGHNPYNLFTFTIDYSKNFTTR